MREDTCRGQSRASDPLELELEVVVTLLMWVLGTHFGSSARAIHTLNHQVISPTPRRIFRLKQEEGFSRYKAFSDSICKCEGS